MAEIYRLTWATGTYAPPETRYFAWCEGGSDASFRFAERVLELDRNPDAFTAWVRLERLPDAMFPYGGCDASWIKSSSVRPTSEGVLTEEAARQI